MIGHLKLTDTTIIMYSYMTEINALYNIIQLYD